MEDMNNHFRIGMNQSNSLGFSTNQTASTH